MQLSGLVGASFASSPTDGFKTKKNFRANLKFFIAGVGLEPTASGL